MLLRFYCSLWLCLCFSMSLYDCYFLEVSPSSSLSSSHFSSYHRLWSVSITWFCHRVFHSVIDTFPKVCGKKMTFLSSEKIFQQWGTVKLEIEWWKRISVYGRIFFMNISSMFFILPENPISLNVNSSRHSHSPFLSLTHYLSPSLTHSLSIIETLKILASKNIVKQQNRLHESFCIFWMSK